MAFFPTGYISWDLAYREALLRCAELTENGYRYFGVVGIENYSSVTNFAPPGNSRRLGSCNAYTACNPPPGSSITFCLLPDLTIKMLRDPIPGVSLDARAIWQKTKEWRQVAYAGLFFFGGKWVLAKSLPAIKYHCTDPSLENANTTILLPPTN